MAQSFNYAPIIFDIVVVGFLMICMIRGYKEGVSRCVRSSGEFFSLIFSVLFAVDVAPHCYWIMKSMIKLGGVIGVSSEMVSSVMKFAIPIILFVIIFSILLAVWRYVTDKMDKWTTKKCFVYVDKWGGVLMELLMGITIVALLGWIIYDFLGLISTSVMQSTIVVSTILNIL